MIGFISEAKSLLVIVLQSRGGSGTGLSLVQEIIKDIEKNNSNNNVAGVRIGNLTSKPVLTHICLSFKQSNNCLFSSCTK